jgi:hypothetical protein
MNKYHSGEITVEHAERTLVFQNTRTFEQKRRTKHIDKLKRATLEAIQAAHANISSEDFKGKVKSGMADGGVVRMGDVRVAEIPKLPGQFRRAEVADFKIYAEKITKEAQTFNWTIDGVDDVQSYKRMMEE